MDTEKVKQIEHQLERRGYKRYTKNLIGNEDYAYMRTVRYADGELKYIISHGFYEWEDDEGALEKSRPTRACGLKHKVLVIVECGDVSRPTRACGLKL